MQTTEKAFVLKKQIYGDADLILTCLRSSGARFSVLARAALKSKKRFGGGVLEPLHYVMLTYDMKSAESAGQDLGVLREASLIEDFAGLRQDYDRLQMALRITKVIYTLSREAEGPDGVSLFNLYGNTLRALAVSTQPELIWVQFITKLLHGQGILTIDPSTAVILKNPMANSQGVESAIPNWKTLRVSLERQMAEYLGRSI